MSVLKKEILEEINDAWLNLPSNIELIKPLDMLDREDPNKFHKTLTWLLTNPEYFGFLCKNIFNVDLLPFQCLILEELWNHKFPMLIATRGGGKTFLLSLYAMIRSLILPEQKVIITGAAFRQSKFLHDYMESIWKKAPILQNICDSNSGPRRATDACYFHINDSKVSCLPIGDGSKIRGNRATCAISDEFASCSREIFETVVAGFGAVSASPAENVKRMAAIKKAAELGISIEDAGISAETQSNQLIISGTAYYDFNHFAEYWKRWRNIIKSRGEKRHLKEIFGEDDIPDNFKWQDYSIIRFPYDVIPAGFMDETQISRSKATIHTGVFQIEYKAVFAKDSMGFFKRSLIEACTGTDQKPIETSSGEIYFDTMLKGNPHKKYYMGVDTASERDNFSIILIEDCGDYRKIVYCWTTTRNAHKDIVRKGLTKEQDFYCFCARKIRDLMKRFNVVHISIDAQGGGISVYEALHDEKNLETGELQIWPVIEEDKEKDTDDERGLHILELCQFARADWLSEANHGMRKDLEDKVLLFPRFDAITLGLAAEEDAIYNRTYDTFEDAVMEIEELKNELCLIEITRTASGREHWDTPEIKIGVGKKERMKKDRYSALLMANMAARQKAVFRFQDYYEIGGGFSGRNKSTQSDYIGPSWFVDAVRDLY